MSKDWAGQLPLVPVTVYEEGYLQTMYRPFHEARSNRFVGDFTRFLEERIRPEVCERLQGVDLVAHRAKQAREALQLLEWGLTDEAKHQLAPAFDFIIGLEHASTPYLTERAQTFALDVPTQPFPKDGPAHPDLLEQLIVVAEQASRAVALRAMQPDVDDGDYATAEEALAATWTQECCCSILYRFEDQFDFYDLEFSYISLADGLSRSMTCYTWEYLHPQRELVIDLPPQAAAQLQYGKKEEEHTLRQAITTQTASDLISILGLIRDDAQDALHSVSRSFM